jgi:ATP-binding cassette, subfamily B, bacterial HlyB/CyaB
MKVDQQLKHNDCGVSAVKIIYNVHNLHVSRKFIEENIYLSENGSSFTDLKDFLDKQRFKTTINLLDLNTLKFNQENIKKYLPCILPVRNPRGQHYVVIEGIHKKKARVLDPATGQTYNWSFTELTNRAYTGTANYDYVSNSQILTNTIVQELEAYKIDPSEVEQFDKAEVINKLTYFSYLKENFGFANQEAEKNFLKDLLFNQEMGMIPQQFKTLKLKEAKLRITVPVVLTVHKSDEIQLNKPTAESTAKPVNSYRRLVSEMKPYHKLWGIYIISALIAAFITQLTIFSSQILIDNILPSYNLNILILFAVGLGIFRIFSLLLSTYKSFISIHLANIFDNFFLTSFIDKLNSFSIRYIHTFSRGDLTERIKDSLQLKSFFIRFFTGIIINGFVTIYSLFVLFMISWKITLIVVGILFIFVIWFNLIVPYIRENENRRFMEKSNLFSTLFENIDGLQVIKSFRLESIFSQRLAPKIKSILAIQRKVKYVSLVNSGVINLIIIVAGIVILVLLSRTAIVDKTISIGQIITYLLLMGQVFSSVSSILDENLDLQENAIILKRYFDFGKTEAANQQFIHSKIKSFDLERIEFRDVSFHYIPQKPVFTNLSVIINKGDKIRLEGSNGAGKSTFCKVLSLLYAPDGGEILINGEKYSFYNPSYLRKKILLVSNEDILFNDTIGYNITFDYTTNPQKILSLAKEIGLYDFIADKAEGLDFIITEQGKNLSTGQRKKILMMRALLSSAELIIFDETLSGIDKESKEQIEKYLNTRSDLSFIIISHEQLEHIQFTKTVTIQNGHIEQLQLQGV